MNKYFSSNLGNLDKAFEDELAIFKKCIKDDRIHLDKQLRAYDLCPPDGLLFRDFIVGE